MPPIFFTNFLLFRVFSCWCGFYYSFFHFFTFFHFVFYLHINAVYFFQLFKTVFCHFLRFFCYFFQLFCFLDSCLAHTYFLLFTCVALSNLFFYFFKFLLLFCVFLISGCVPCMCLYCLLFYLCI
jgi:hypothetical protein